MSHDPNIYPYGYPGPTLTDVLRDEAEAHYWQEREQAKKDEEAQFLLLLVP